MPMCRCPKCGLPVAGYRKDCPECNHSPMVNIGQPSNEQLSNFVQEYLSRGNFFSNEGDPSFKT